MVSLEYEATIGLGTPIGLKTYDRVLMGSNPTPNSKKGDYAIRQFLREKEASFLANFQGSIGDVGIVLIRGLTKIVEIDDVILRRTREYYRGFTNVEVCVMMTTLQHDSPKAYLDFLADEPIMVVTLCGPMLGGSSLRRSIELGNDGTGLLRIGSITLQTFTDLSVVQGKVGPTTGRIWEIDTSNLMEDEDVCDLIIELGERINDVEILVKAKRHKTWYAVLKSHGKGKEDKAHLGRLGIKDMYIPKPSDRQGQYERDYDPGNLAPVVVDRSSHSNTQKGLSKAPNIKRWEPERESLERRESIRASSTGANANMKAASTPHGKTSANTKPASSIFDRYKEPKKSEFVEDRDPKEPMLKMTKANKYGRTPGGGQETSEDI
jgi:hypothetical protein